MRCLNCGKELGEKESFCSQCGTLVEDGNNDETMVVENIAAPVDAPVEATPEQAEYGAVPVMQEDSEFAPEPSAPVQTEEVFTQEDAEASVAAKEVKKPAKRWKKIALIAAISVGALALIAGIIVLIMYLQVFGGDRGKIVKAIMKSSDAYEEVTNHTIPDARALTADQKYSVDLDLEFENIVDEEQFNGLGLQLAVDYDQPGRELGVQLVPSYGSVDIATAGVYFNDNHGYIGLEEVVGKSLYGVNTETLGEDIRALNKKISITGFTVEQLFGLPSGALDDVSFNVFDLLESEEAPGLPTFGKERKDKLLAAFKEVVKKLNADKQGTVTMDINGHSVECTEYHVVITEKNLKKFLGSAKEAFAGLDVLAFYRMIGVSEEEIDMLEDAFEAQYGTNDIMTVILEELEKLAKDLPLTFYLSDGYVVGVMYEAKEEDMSFGIYLGGGENYTDDLGMEVKMDGETMLGLQISTTADETGEAFTKRFLFQAASVEMEVYMEYDRAAMDDNFALAFSMQIPEYEESMELTASGYLESSETQYDLDLDNICLAVDGMDVMELNAHYTVTEYAGQRMDLSKAELLSELSLTDIGKLAYNLMINGQDWADGVKSVVSGMLVPAE